MFGRNYDPTWLSKLCFGLVLRTLSLQEPDYLNGKEQAMCKVEQTDQGLTVCFLQRNDYGNQDRLFYKGLLLLFIFYHLLIIIVSNSALIPTTPNWHNTIIAVLLHE